MNCGQDLQYVIQLTLHLGDLPKPTSDWTNMRFTCRYDLEAGPLILTVKELQDVDTAKQYFIGLQRNMGSSQDISGITSLGFARLSESHGPGDFPQGQHDAERRCHAAERAARRRHALPRRLCPTNCHKRARLLDGRLGCGAPSNRKRISEALRHDDVDEVGALCSRCFPAAVDARLESSQNRPGLTLGR